MRFPIKTSSLMNILLLAVAAGVGVGAVRMTHSTLSLRAEVQMSEKLLEDTAVKKQELLRRLAEQDAPETVDYQAKARMNLKNSGEEVVVVVSDEPILPPAEPVGFWQYVKDWFSKIF